MLMAQTSRKKHSRRRGMEKHLGEEQVVKRGVSGSEER